MEYNQAFFLFTATIKFFDALVVLGVWYLCWYLRFDSSFFPITKGLPEFEAYSQVSLPLMLVFSAIFHVVGAYRRDRIQFGFRSLKKIVQGSILGTLMFISVIYFRGEVQYSRLYIGIFSVLVMFLILLERSILQILWEFAERTMIRKIRILLVGTGNLLRLYFSQIDKRRPYPVQWIGRLGEKDPEGSLPLRYLGTEENLSDVLQREQVDLVVISYRPDSQQKYSEVLQALSNELVGVRVIPDFGKFNTFTYTTAHEFGIPLLLFNQTPVGTTDRVMKRLVDITGSLLFMFFFFPAYALIALCIKATLKGPILFSQRRIGADGQLFTLYKFRTMQIDAEKETGPVWATQNDARTTPLGKWLRRTSLDELPQFFNVLRGEMSLVGPRPERPVFVDQFKKEVPKYMLRHKMKSGITGWAQVNGWRGNTSIEERIKYDLYYIGHWSHYFDFKILSLTLLKGFVNRHAY